MNRIKTYTMKIIIAVKNNKAIYGSPEKVAPFLGLTGEAIRIQIRAAKNNVIAKNDYVVYLNTERIK